MVREMKKLGKRVDKIGGKVVQIEQSLPPAVFGRPLTPSDAAKSDHVRDYRDLIDQLGLGAPVLDEVPAPEEGGLPQFRYDWTGNGPSERKAYEPARLFVEGLIAQRLPPMYCEVVRCVLVVQRVFS